MTVVDLRRQLEEAVRPSPAEALGLSEPGVTEIRLPYALGATLARLECDRDVAMGMPVTGPELDALERLASPR